jgi:hypothetical protein
VKDQTAPRLSLLDLHLLGLRHPATLMACLLILLGSIVAVKMNDTSTSPQTPAPLPHIQSDAPFRQILLPGTELPAAQQALLDSARELKLKTGQVDYSQDMDSAGGFKRAILRLPLNGSYPDIRMFIERSLNTYPSLALRQLLIERTTIENSLSGLQATLTVEFLLQAEQP